MIRKIGVALLCVGGLFATNAFSITNHEFKQGLTVEYELAPNDPQVFSNVFFWTIKSTCTVISEFPDNSIFTTMIRKSGSVNGIPLTAPDAMSLTAQPGDKLNITAESGAKVELVNLGLYTIKASCSAA